MDFTSLFTGPTTTPQSIFGNGNSLSPLMQLFGGGANSPQMQQMMMAQKLLQAGQPQFLPPVAPGMMQPQMQAPFQAPGQIGSIGPLLQSLFSRPTGY